jgi:hypothetical protein
MRNIVRTIATPNAVGPYTQAVKGGGFIFASGQLSLHPDTQQIIEGNAFEETERALENIASILESAGSAVKRLPYHYIQPPKMRSICRRWFKSCAASKRTNSSTVCRPRTSWTP